MLFIEDPLPPPFYENIENKRNWLACLEFTYTDRFGGNKQDVPEDYSSEDSLWMRLYPRLSPSPRLTELIRGLEDKQNPVERPKWSGKCCSLRMMNICLYAIPHDHVFLENINSTYS